VHRFAFSDATPVHGGENGTRNFVVAAGCAYPDHHSAVVVLRPLKAAAKNTEAFHSIRLRAGAEPDLFFRAVVSLAFVLKNPL
jgi:hypothetical protein